jgi:hypothetical protein
MAAARLRRNDWRTSKPRHRSQGWSKRSGASRPEILYANESARAEEIDRLLLSSLRYWEVERDLIEERMAAIGSVIVSS